MWAMRLGKREAQAVVSADGTSNEKATRAEPQAEKIALLDRIFAAPAAAVLTAWDAAANRVGNLIGALDAPMQVLRALLAGKAARSPRDSDVPRKLATARSPSSASVLHAGKWRRAQATLRLPAKSMPGLTASVAGCGFEPG